jgi:hypothetical protein
MNNSIIATFFLIAFAFGLSSFSVQAHELDDSMSVKIEPAAFATYTPSMAARGQHFYVGP